MKKVFSIVMVLTLTLALASAALASVPAPGGPFNSAFRVQNLEGTAATCSYAFYGSDGVAAFTSGNESVAPGDSLYVYVPDVSGLLTGSYSAVVSCDRKVAAVSNFSDANSGASYSGVAEPGMEWFAPGIYDNYFDYYSNVVVQNASASAVDVTLQIFEPGNTTPVFEATETAVPANAAVSFEQEGLDELVDDQFYSAKISATGNVAPIVNIYGKGTADNQLYSYNAFTAGSTTAYAPVIMSNYYGYNTALVVQNIGAADAAVTVEYTNGFSADYTIAPGAAESIYTPGVAGVPSGDVLYGATVTSDQPVVVLVNESSATGTNRAASYSGFAGGSEEVRAPIVMKRYYGYNSSVTCQNLGAAATDLTVTYAGAGVGAPTVYAGVAAGATQLIYQPTDGALSGVAPNWIGSATIAATEPIVCVVNQDMNELPQAAENMDQLYSYNGIAP
jgi:hypothetical protein